MSGSSTGTTCIPLPSLILSQVATPCGHQGGAPIITSWIAMAAASICNCTLRLQATPSRPPYLHYRNGGPKGKNEQLPCQSRMYRNGKTKLKAAPVFVGEEEEKNKSRRLMLQILFSAIPLTSAVDHSSAEPSSQGAEQYQLFTDDTNKFSISIPPDWLVGQGEPDASRSIVAFFPEGNTSSSVSVVITGLSPDFTRLESFGNVDAFAENLIGGLDRSWQRPPGVAAKLLDSKAKNGFYYIEYSLQNPGESLKYIYTALGISSNGWYNRLYTVTGQFFEEDSEKYGSTIQKRPDMEDDLTEGGTLERRSKPCSTIIATRKGSHSIAKQAAAAKSSPSSPTVRIIHVVPPEIIKTDPCNFRELVQKLTGKPMGRSRCTRHRATGKQQTPARSETAAAAGRAVPSPVAPDLKQDEDDSSRKSTANPSLFFNSLGDLDSIFPGISQTASSDHISQSSPLLPLDTNNHHAFELN